MTARLRVTLEFDLHVDKEDQAAEYCDYGDLVNANDEVRYKIRQKFLADYYVQYKEELEEKFVKTEEVEDFSISSCELVRYHDND